MYTCLMSAWSFEYFYFEVSWRRLAEERKKKRRRCLRRIKFTSIKRQSSKDSMLSRNYMYSSLWSMKIKHIHGIFDFITDLVTYEFLWNIIKHVLMVRRTFRIGIIGEPLAMFNLQTLSPLGADNEDEENEEEGEKQ